MSSERLALILQQIPRDIELAGTVYRGGILCVTMHCTYLGIGPVTQAHAIMELICEARRLVDAAEREDGDE